MGTGSGAFHPACAVTHHKPTPCPLLPEEQTMTSHRDDNVTGLCRRVHSDAPGDSTITPTNTNTTNPETSSNESISPETSNPEPCSTNSTTPLDLTRDRDATVEFEHTFDTSSEGQPTWQADTETGARSSARPSTGPSSPASSARPASTSASTRTSRQHTKGTGRGSLGVLMPTLLPSRPKFTGRNTNDVGSLTHALIGFHVGFLTSNTTEVVVPGDLLERMFVIAYALIDANPNATRVLATEACSLAYRYLTQFPPAAPWRLLGVEYDTGCGRVDLAWANDTTGEVFFDEVKTSLVHHGRSVPRTWVSQASRYSEGGHVRFGETFRGTRLVMLTGADITGLVTHQDPVVMLSPTATEPLRRAPRTSGSPARPGQPVQPVRPAQPVRSAPMTHGGGGL